MSMLATTHSLRELILDLFGLRALGRDADLEVRDSTIPTPVLIESLAGAGVTETAVRTTLSRMTSRGEVIRCREGRTSSYRPSADTLENLTRGRRRMFSPHPFDHDEDTWTVLSCTLPSSLRNERYQLQVRLEWAGFGLLRPNLWIAPGHHDVSALLAQINGAAEHTYAFEGAAVGPQAVGELVRSAWDLDGLRAAHRAFVDRWSRAPSSATTDLGRFLLLLQDWGLLLRADPGLPTSHVAADWPAHDSAALFAALNDQFGATAEQSLDHLYATGLEIDRTARRA